MTDTLSLFLLVITILQLQAYSDSAQPDSAR